MQRDHPLLNRSFANKPLHKHILRLPDSVHPVHSLILHRRVPPGVHNKHIVRHHQIQAHRAKI